MDESGRVHDVLIIDSLPDHILSATVTQQFRFHRWQAATSQGKAVASVFPMDMYFVAEQRQQAVDWAAQSIREPAAAGDSDAQYKLSRLIPWLKNPDAVGDLNAGELTARAAAGGTDGRAMYFLRHRLLGGDEGADFDFVVGERRRLVMASAQTGFAPAQVIMAMSSWAERTPEGYARARRWLTAARGRNAMADKYLAALLIAHPVDAAADARQALEIARAASKTLYGMYDADLWQALAAAHAAVGEFGAAKRAQRRARSHAEMMRWPTQDIERRLEAYSASRTITEELVTIPVVARELRTDEIVAAR